MARALPNKAVSEHYVFTDECPGVCLEAIPATDNHHRTCPFHQPDLGVHWCPECRCTVQVEDIDTHASRMTARGEEEWTGYHLACGHSVTENPRIVGPAPGAPYAGPGVVVAATPRMRDRLAAARAESILRAADES